MLNAERLRRLLAAQAVCQRVSAASLAAAVHQKSEMEADYQLLVDSASGSNPIVSPEVVLALCSLRKRSLKLQIQSQLVGERSEAATLQARLARQIERLIEVRMTDEQKIRTDLETEEVLNLLPWSFDVEGGASFER